MTMTFDERYRAIQSRDARFDGQFITAVRSTGIYCRPSCPARTPKPENVTFYATGAAAQEAGYRACKRCLPEAAPGSPEWYLRGDVAARAMRLIADGVVEREGVPGLADRLGYSSRHLNRLLTAELGAGPLALSRAHRAQTARMLLVGTELTMAQVSQSSGFASVRQFNQTMAEVFDQTPTQLRARRRGGAGSAGTAGRAGVGVGRVTNVSGSLIGEAGGNGRSDRISGHDQPDSTAQPGRLELALPHRGPLDSAGLFAWFAARAIPGVESTGTHHYARTVRLSGGPAWFEVRDDGRGVLRLSARLARLSDLPQLVARVRRLFDLDADPVAVDSALSMHPELADAVAATPGIRMPGTVDPGEQLIRAMIGQQVSVAAARTALTRLTEALGEAVAEREGTHRLFPTMATIAERGHEVLRGPAARVRAVIGAATAVAEGTLKLSMADVADDQRAALLALPGVGPWTADYARMRISGDPDVFLPGDVALRAGAARLGIPADARALTEWATRAAPWRSYLSMHLWRAASAPPDRDRTTVPLRRTSKDPA